MLETKEVKKEKNELKDFINFPWKIYNNDPYWIPPLKSDLLETFLGKDVGKKINCGPHAFFMAWDKDVPVGRILVGINEEKNLRNGSNVGYFGYLELINSHEVLKSLIEQSFRWLKKYNIDHLIGPVCPDDDVEGRGLLIKGFNSSPVLMNSYNPPYYPALMEEYGFIKDKDFYAYYSDKLDSLKERVERIADFAMQKFNFRIDKVDMKYLEREIQDVAEIVEKIISSGNEADNGFEYANPPTYDSLSLEIKKYLPFLDRDLFYIARSGDDPIGFVFAIPDYNEVLKKINGQLYPFGIFKYLWYKRKIRGIRGFAQFVVPKFQNKAVNAAIFKHILDVAKRKQYDYIEGSSIYENNISSRRIFENAGLFPYKIYRVYQKNNSTI